jgi:hypothetical protein
MYKAENGELYYISAVRQDIFKIPKVTQRFSKMLMSNIMLSKVADINPSEKPIWRPETGSSYSYATSQYIFEIPTAFYRFSGITNKRNKLSGFADNYQVQKTNMAT